MTDITLGLPIGGFYWRGGIPGNLCGATVTWVCDYASTEPVAIPPFIDYIGGDVVVTNILPECESIPSYVSPGVLTLTPTVTCPDPNGGVPVVTVLPSLFLAITEGGCSAPGGCVDTMCPFPRNPIFENGLTEWAYAGVTLVQSPTYIGTNAVRLDSPGSYLQQSVTGVCEPTGTFEFVFRGQVSVDSTVSVNLRQYNDQQLLDDYTVNPVTFLASQTWERRGISRAWATGVTRFIVTITSNSPDVYIDEAYSVNCP